MASQYQRGQELPLHEEKIYGNSKCDLSPLEEGQRCQPDILTAFIVRKKMYHSKNTDFRVRMTRV